MYCHWHHVMPDKDNGLLASQLAAQFMKGRAWCKQLVQQAAT
jgi:hypothetical protein